MTAGAVRTAADAVLVLRNTGTSAIPVSSIALSGSGDFTIRELATLPVSIDPGRSLSFIVRYLPSATVRVTALLTITYAESGRPGAFAVGLSGTAADIVVSYVLQPAGNTVLLPAGGTLPFPVTNIGATATATIIVANRGTGPATVRSVSVRGNEFQPGGLPLLPAVLDTGRDLRFSMLFSPRALAAASGQFDVALDGGTQTFSLTGSGSGASYRYEVISDTGAAAVQPGQAVSLPDTAVGQKSALRVRVTNQGNAEGKVTAVNVSGTGFQLSDVPFLPATVPVGGSFAFTLTFSATQPGSESGRLRIGDDTFDLRAMGIGSALTFSYQAGITLANNGTILFSPLPVGKTASVTLVVANRGTAPATLTAIGISGANSPFSLSGLPELPVSIAPDQTLELTIQFAPAALGSLTSALRVDSFVFTLSGVGAAPPALPAYKFEGLRSEEAPMQQVTLALSLAEPYTLPLNGTLKMEYGSEVFGSDPSVQFATGGRNVAFTIPAGATRAVFPNQSDVVRLQTGSIAGVISLQPSFATEHGVDVTPSGAAAATIQVLPVAPKILSAVVTSKTAAGFTLQLTAFATTRALSRMDFEFIPAAGVSLSAQTTSLNVEAAFLAWYQSQQSQQYGSLFTVSVPFTLSGTLSSGQTIVEGLQSVSVTMANPVGVSERVAVALK